MQKQGPNPLDIFEGVARVACPAVCIGDGFCMVACPTKAIFQIGKDDPASLPPAV